MELISEQITSEVKGSGGPEIRVYSSTYLAKIDEKVIVLYSEENERNTRIKIATRNFLKTLYKIYPYLDN
jgi:hypothetical protein